MRFLHTLPLRFRSLFRRARVEGELDEELRDYLERRVEQEIAAGASAEEARRIAQLALGSLELRKEQCRDTRRTQWLEQLVQDLRYSGRTLGRSPGFTAVALLSLALGIGANAAIFSVINALLLRPLPVPDSGHLVRIRAGGSHVSYANLEALREQSGLLAGLAGHNPTGFSLTRGDASTMIPGEVVTPDYFRVVGVAPMRGRALEDGDAQSAVVSYEFWQRYNGDPNFSEITLDGRRFAVIGVMPRGFHGIYAWGLNPQVWIAAARETGRTRTMLQLVGRLKPDVAAEQAQAEISALVTRLEQRDTEREARLSPVEILSFDGIDSFRGFSTAPAVFLFLGFLTVVSGLVLAIACANVASLLLGRATARRREIATRMALGAGRGRVLRQLLTESALLALLGSVAGVALAQTVPNLFPLLLRGLPIDFRVDASPDWRVLGYTIAVSLVSAVVFGLKPALDATRGSTGAMLKDSAGHGGGGGRFHLRGMLVAGQVAVSFALLIAGGLFLRSLANVQTARPGFDVEHGITAPVTLPPERYTRDQALALYDSLLDRLQTLPGVTSASYASIVPLSLNNTRFRIRRANEPGLGIMIYVNAVGPDYFRTLAIPLLRGREITRQDRGEAPRVAILNETLARRLFPEGAVGQSIATGGGLSWEIVGVVANSKYMTLGEEPLPVLYTSIFQTERPDVVLHVRAAGAPGPMLAPVKREIEQVDPYLAIDMRTMQQNLETGFGPARLGAALLGVFGVVALLLASVGVFGVVAYTVSRRSREIGIRVALGARRVDVLRLVIADGMILCGAGLGAGALLALGLASAIRSFLVGVEPADPATFATVLGVLGGSALLASYLPARRSLRVDPSVTLRQE